MRHAIKPEVVEGDRGDTIHRHPAFGNISVSQISGDAYLYGADFEIRNYLVIRIAHSSARRDLSRFQYRDEEQIVEVAVSPAQWAAFVSSTHMGTGVCATITRIGNQSVPGILPTETEAELHAKESDDAMREARQALADLQAEIDELKISGVARKRLQDKIDKAAQGIGSTQGFVRDSFSSFVDKKTEAMKTNLHAYAETTLVNLGLESVKRQIATIDAIGEPLRIEHDDPDPTDDSTT